MAYREPAPTQQRKANPFLGIAKKAKEDREALDVLLATIVAELHEAITEDLGPIAVLSVANDVLTIVSRKSSLTTSIQLPIKLYHDGYNIGTVVANRANLEAYFSTQVARGTILDVLLRINNS